MFKYIRKYKHKKGFTIIELAVVIAVVAVLVLLASPRFIGQTEKAKMAQIQNDIRVAETKVAEWLAKEDKRIDDWDFDDEVNADGTIVDKELKEGLGAGGPLENISGVIKDEINTNLAGEFYSNKDGKVYYHMDKLIDIGEADDKDDSDSIIVEPPKGSNKNPVSYTDNEGTEYSYYGEVSVDDLIRGDELAQRVKLNSGSPINSDENWLKISKGNENAQILYVAKKPYRYGMMWATDLYNLGLTGDEAIKPYLNYDWYENISQTKYININGNKYRVRLLTNEEWDKIIIPLASLNGRDINSGTNMFKAGENGEGFTEKELGVNYKVSPSGARNYVQDNDLNGSSSDVIVRGYNGVADKNTNSVGSMDTITVGWRPVLEYVGPSSSSFEKGTYTDSDTGITYNYNGKINSEDFITGSQLARLVGLSEGKPINDDADWLYYSYGKESSEKHLLVAQKAVRNGIMWAPFLYNLGLVGDSASKPYPWSDSDNISQETYITVKGNMYRVRLLTNDEWDHLIVPIASPFGRGRGNELGSNLFEVGPNGEGLSDLDLGVNHNVTKSGTKNYVQDFDSKSDVIVRGHESVAHYDTNSVGSMDSNAVGWRPVLEHVKTIGKNIKNGKTIQEGVPSEDSPSLITHTTNVELNEKTVELSGVEPLRSVEHFNDMLYQDEQNIWKIRRDVASITIDGSESWVKRADSTPNGLSIYSFNLDDIHPLPGILPGALSSHYRYLGPGSYANSTNLPNAVEQVEEGFILWGTPKKGSSNIYVITEKSSLGEFKDFLSNNPVYIQYNIAEPYDETLSSHLQNKLNKAI